jgi:hypothetical protein
MNHYKFIFVDFKNTVFIENCFAYDHHSNYEKLADSMYLQKRGRLNQALIRWIKQQKDVGSKIILLSDCDNSLEYCIQVKYLKVLEPDVFDEFLGVCSDDEKINMIQAYQQVYNLSEDEICFVDDSVYALEQAKKQNFKIWSALQITNAFA